jgi:RNA polymerase sigma-70 factor (ECF subfamily)
MSVMTSEDLDSYKYAAEDLVLRDLIRSGDTGALAALIEKHARRIHFIIYRIIEGFGEWEDVEELVQDVFTNVWYQIDKYDPSRGTLAKWINMQAKYTALQFRRDCARKYRPLESLQEMQAILIDDPLTDHFAKMEKEQQLSTLRAALRELPEEKTQLIIWHYLEGKTYQEIANLLSCPEGTAKSKIHRALKQLRLLVYLNS